MKLRNLKINESIEKEYSHALENEHTVLEPTEANALEVEKERKEISEEDFKEQNKIADEVAKATNATEVNEPKKVKDRRELSRLLAEAKEAGKQFKISRCDEEGYRYLFETIETEENKELLTEKKGTKYVFFGVDKDNNEVVKKEFVDVNGVVKEIKVERNKLFDDDKVETVYVSEIDESGEEKPVDKYMISRSEFIKDESLKEENGDPSLDEKLPETFEGKMDFLAADEEEAIEGYDKVLLALEEGDPVREQLEKIRDEEVAHKEFLEKVKSDKTAVYKAPSEAEEVKDAVDLDESKLEESDEPAAESIENCQKWVDYDMEHYGDVSKNTQEIIDKAGFQLIKDDHGDYEVAARDYDESLTEETNYEKIMKALDKDNMNEKLDFNDQDELTHELYDALKGIAKKYLSKGIDSDDLESAFEFCIIHAEDDEEFPDEFFKNPTWGKKEVEEKSVDVEVEEDNLPPAEEKLEESNGKKRAGDVLNDNQSIWGVAKSPDEMRSLVLKVLEDHKDEMDEKDYQYAKMTFEKANRNAIFSLVATFTTGMAMNPNKEHKQIVKDLEVEESLEEGCSKKEELEDECEECSEEEDEKPFEEEKVEYEIDDEFDWKY